MHSIERLGTLNGRADGTVDDQLRKDAERTGDAEENGVVVLLGETVVLEEDTRVLGSVSYSYCIQKQGNLQHRR